MRTRLAVMAWTVALAMGATNAAAQGLSWGLKGGIGFGSLNTEGGDAFETSPDPGGMLGGFVGVDIGAIVRLQPEAYWSVRRFSATGVPTPFAVSSRGVEVPLLLQVRVPKARSTQAVLFSGPQFSVIGTVEQRIGSTATDISDQIRDRDVGVVFGAGLERVVNTGAFVVDVRAVIGTRNLAEAGEDSIKSRAIQLLVGYRF